MRTGTSTPAEATSGHRTRRRRRTAAPLLPVAVTVLALAATPAQAVGPADRADAAPVAAAATNAGDWPSWQHDPRGSRYNGAETAITPSTVAGLRPKWSFVFPDVDSATGSQPAVVGDTLYVGSRDNRFYALDARTGGTRWTFDLSPVAGPASAAAPNPVRTGPAVSGDRVVFGDNRGHLYALRRRTGELLWSLRLSDHPTARLTSSPLIHHGTVYVGVSSSEEGRAANPAYACCTFRGQLAAVDLATGAVRWRYYTVPTPVRAGSWPNGVPRYTPSGVAVWGSPVVDPATRTLYFATGNNYTGVAGDADSVLALDAATGRLRWRQRMAAADEWTVGCLNPPDRPHCPGLENGTNLDYDFGTTPNLFRVGARTLVGTGQKSGVYHAFDAATGRVVWQRQLSVPQPNGGSSGIQWGTSYDGQRLYVATQDAAPGTLFALDPATGRILWRTPNPADGCRTGGAVAHPDTCKLAHISAVTSTPCLVYEGSADGKMRIYRASDGAVLWQYDTVRQYTGANGLTGSGGSVAGNGGAVVAHGMLYVQSGYYTFAGMPGRVLIAFGL